MWLHHNKINLSHIRFIPCLVEYMKIKYNNCVRFNIDLFHNFGFKLEMQFERGEFFVEHDNTPLTVCTQADYFYEK